MIFSRIRDFSDVLEAMPREHPRYRILNLLDEVIRRDVHFIDRHPTTLFQCLWNSCWWYDCPQAALHYSPPAEGWAGEPPWLRPGTRLYELLESWLAEKQAATPGFGWLRALRPPLTHLGGALRAVYCGHEDFVYSVAWSPDGTRIASGSGDRTVRIWDPGSGEMLVCLKGHSKGVKSVMFSPDGQQIVSGGWDGTVRFWDIVAGTELRCIRNQTTVLSVTWSSRNLVASGSGKGDDCTIQILDASNGSMLACLKGHADDVHSVAFSPDGTRIVSGSEDNTVRVWDVASGAQTDCLVGHECAVNAVVFSPDGMQIASGSDDETVRLWDAISGTKLACLRHSSCVSSIAFSADGSRIASGEIFGNAPPIRVWDLATNKQIADHRGHLVHVESVAFSPDGRWIASGALDKTVRLWSSEPADPIGTIHPQRSETYSVARSPDGQFVAVASDDPTVWIWHAFHGLGLDGFRGHESKRSCVAFSPDSSQIASGGDDGTVRVWDVATNRQLACLQSDDGPVTGIAFSPDGRRLASGTEKGTVYLWDVVGGATLAALNGHESWVDLIVFTADGRQIVSFGPMNQTVRLWDVASAQLLLAFKVHAGEVSCLAVSPNSHWIVLGSLSQGDNDIASVLDMASGELVAALGGHRCGIDAVAFSPDSHQVVTNDGGQAVRIWDASTWECLQVLKGIGDVAAIAAGPAAFPWRVFDRGGEMVLEVAANGCEVAWFPTRLEMITALVGGRVWCGIGGGRMDVHLFKLCGMT